MSPAKNNYFYPPEVWGGIECTINRVGDRYKDQCMSIGHYHRPADIRHIAALGITTLRYPVLWEFHQPRRETPIDWKGTDTRLDSIRSNGMKPVVGLLHHGSGPAFTNLESPDFALDFANYAALVARRYPWITQYNPINEPLTTARFSGLYGIWYPHAKDPCRFIDMLLNELKAVVMAMEAIRNINPDAKLIQTEDLAKVHSTSSLAYQANFENNRRWLTFDLLCGKLNKHHPLWDYLQYLGVDDRKLGFFSEHPCPPDMLGINYYITSERYLDEDWQKYPEGAHGGNGRHVYADTEAVRTVGILGLHSLLNEVWDRYHLPIAITEAHINCTREEQMRWLKGVWEDSCRAKRAGMDLRAVTSWALFGAHDWDSLLTRNELHYESGAFTVRENKLQLTAVGSMIRSLAAKGDFSHPLLEQQGWWQRRIQDLTPSTGQSRPLLIAVSVGDECQRLGSICTQRGIVWQTIHMLELNLGSRTEMHRRIEEIDPWGVLIGDTGNAASDTLARVCGYVGIPFRKVLAKDLSCSARVNEVLDHFIDDAVGIDHQNEDTTRPIKQSAHITSYAK